MNIEYWKDELAKAEKRLVWNKHRGGRGYIRALDNRNTAKKNLDWARQQLKLQHHGDVKCS